MSVLYEHEPHPHLARRQAAGPAKVVDQRRLDHPNPVVRLNARVGLVITVLVGTMWCAYLFAAIALISLPENIHSTQNLILWISSSFLQLVLLPVIIVGQNIQAKAADKRAEDTYNDADAVLHEVGHIQKHLEAQDAQILAILDKLQGLASAQAGG
jgi:type VI protein secretion system component VasK